MRKWIICFLIFIIIVAGGLGGYLLSFDINGYRQDVERKLSEIVGQTVTVKGELYMEKSFSPTLIMRDVVIADPLNASRPMVHIDEALVQFNLFSYLKHVYSVNQMSLTNVKLNLMRSSNGNDNWSWIFNQNSPRRVVDESGHFRLDYFKVNGLDVLLEDQKEEKAYSIHFSKLSLEQLVNLDGVATYGEEKINLKGSFMNLQEALSGGKRLEFVMDMRGYGMQVTYSCLIPDLKNLTERTLNVRMQGENLNKTLNAFYDLPYVPEVGFDFQSAIKMTDGRSLAEGSLALAEGRAQINLSNVVCDHTRKLWNGRIQVEAVNETFMETFGLRPFTMTSTFQMNPERLVMSMTGVSNETDIEGVLNVGLKDEKKLINGQLKSRYFSVKDILSKSTYDQIGASLFPVEMLNKVDLNVYVLIENLDARGIFKRFPRVYAHAMLKDGELDIDVMEGTMVADGRVVGNIHLRPAAKRLNGTIKLVTERLNADQIVALKDNLKGGFIHSNINLSISGRNMREWLPSVSGKVSILAFESEVLGMNSILKELQIAPFSTSTGKTVNINYAPLLMKDAYVTVALKDGVASFNKKAVFATNRFDAMVDGEVNLKDDTYALTLTPYSLKSDEKFPEYIILSGDFNQANSIRYSKQAIRGDDANPYEKVLRNTEVNTVDQYLGKAPDPQPVAPKFKASKTSTPSQAGGLVPANSGTTEVEE